MKKKIIFPVVIIAVLLFAFALVACAGDPINNTAVYTIRFNNNFDGGSVKQVVVAGDEITLAQAPTRPGYTFVGWYLSADGDSEQLTADTKLDGNITVFAKWQKNEATSIVTYKYRNYILEDTVVVVNNGSTLEQPADPKYDENETYAFGGWYTNPECTVRYDFSSAVSGDITLYASWSMAKVTVRFNANYTGAAAIAPVVVDIGVPLERPEDPTRPRYAFTGWFTDPVEGTEYDFSAPVEEEFTLYAHWERDEFTVTFDLNGGTAQGVELVYNVKRNTSVVDQAAAIVQKLTYVGHEFIGWYTVKADPDNEAEAPDENEKADLENITTDLRVYAGWTLEEYTVSFDYNYQGAGQAPGSQRVKYGKLMQQPDAATREGYVFIGWFTEDQVNLEDGEQFTIDTPITSNITLYAKWVSQSEARDINLTFVYMLDGVETSYQTVTISFNTPAESKMPDNPAVTDYYFSGWYTSANFTTPFNVKANRYKDVKVYGKMLKKYTFEAESVNLEGKRGQGTSTNSIEEGMLMDHTFVNGGDVSNGYFIREMYYNGAFIEFEIDAEAATDDAVIYLRVSSESYKFQTTKIKDGKEYNYLSSKEYRIAVNGEWSNGELISGFIDYDGIYMPMANLEDKEDLSQHKTPFEDCFIAANVHLDAGTNYITLYVNNNNNHGGTFHAEAPTIDCMYIYSSVGLSAYDYEYYTRPNVNRG